MKVNKKNGVRVSTGEQIFYIVNNIVMAGLIFITLYPMLYVVFASLSSPAELNAHYGLLWRPAGFSTVGYEAVLQTDSIWRGFRNTIFYVIVGTGVSILLTLMGGYAMSKKTMFRGPLMVFFTIPMFFGGGMIPTYLLVKNLHLTNTVWAMIIPGAISTYNMIVMRTSFQSIPGELFESAYLDGANEWVTLFKIVVPVSLPMLATITLFYAVGYWQSWYPALVYLTGRRDLYPLQMFLRELLVREDFTDSAYLFTLMQSDPEMIMRKEVIKYSTIVVTTIPILVVYPFLQRYFVKGVMIGSLKG